MYVLNIIHKEIISQVKSVSIINFVFFLESETFISW